MDKNQAGEQDERLKQLALAAQKHPPMTKERQLALTQLYEEILKSGRLCRPYRDWDYLQGIYEDVYNEALQELWIYICQNIDSYNPERAPVMRWINFLMETRFFRRELDKLKNIKVERRTLAELENIPNPEEETPLLERVKQYIEEDPEGILKEHYIENRPDANFQIVAQKRLNGQAWKSISDDLGIKIPTLSSFYNRSLEKFTHKFKEYCKN